MSDVKFISDVLSLCEEPWNITSQEELWWRTDSEYYPVTFFINCNDLFFWACSDCEQLTPENLPILKQAIRDVRKVLGVPEEKFTEKFPDGGSKEETEKWCARHSLHFNAGKTGCILFCCRERKMRPQIPYYEYIQKELHDLFNEAGGERTGHEHCCPKGSKFNP